MTNAQRILALLDAKLTSPVELTLYGRAALHLGFPDAPIDLLLRKLMRDDPIDRADAQFIVRVSNLGISDIIEAISRARVPDSPEIQEQLERASSKLLKTLTA